MKLTLVSVYARGVHKSAFLMLNANNPQISQKTAEKVLGFYLAYGETFTVA